MRNWVKRAFRASCDLLKPAKYHRSLAALRITVNAHAVVHNAPACRRSRPPIRLANSVSPAQNDGSIGVIGDCKVAKKPVTSGSDSTRSSRSGWMKRRSRTMLPANTSPISIRMSRARRAGKTLTSNSVVPVPAATGMTQNGATVRQRRHVEHARRAAGDADAQQDRQQEDDDHPRRLQHGLHESRVEQPAHGDRRRQQQPQIFGQEERRQRGHDAAEREEREKREEQPRQPDAEEKIAELFVRVELGRNPEGAPEQRREDEQADAAEQPRARVIGPLAARDAIARRPVRPAEADR